MIVKVDVVLKSIIAIEVTGATSFVAFEQRSFCSIWINVLVCLLLQSHISRLDIPEP